MVEQVPVSDHRKTGRNSGTALHTRMNEHERDYREG